MSAPERWDPELGRFVPAEPSAGRQTVPRHPVPRPLPAPFVPAAPVPCGHHHCGPCTCHRCWHRCSCLACQLGWGCPIRPAPQPWVITYGSNTTNRIGPIA